MIRSVGTIMAFFYISIVSSVTTPFNCTEHPNGQMTLISDASVICNSDENGHPQMQAMGVIGGLMPLVFLSIALWTAWQFPQRMSKGDTQFLHCWNFLFMRFTTSAHWYPCVVLIRNTLITFAPLLGGPVAQITGLAFIMFASLWICIFYMPWRIQSGNILDVLCHIVVLVILILCAFFVQESDEKLISQCCFAFIIMCLGTLLGGMGYAMRQRFGKQAKQFQFFLCHHKAGAGSFSRLLKLYLLKQKKVTRKVFMDSDDLQDLDLLFGYVCTHAENFVIVISPEICKRPWCMGELVTAHSNNVKMIPVLIPGGTLPEAKFIEDY